MKKSYILLFIIVLINIIMPTKALADNNFHKNYVETTYNDDITPRIKILNVDIDGKIEGVSDSHIFVPNSAQRINFNIDIIDFNKNYSGKVLFYLDGFDKYPIELKDGQKTVTYTNLKGGNYKFYLIAVNKDGNVVNEQVVKINKNLSFFEYKTAKIIAMIISLITLIILYRKLLKNKTRKLNEQHERYERLVDETITAIANTIDAKDKDTNGHSRRVADYSAKIARRMGIDEEMVKVIHYTGLLHDIGKIGIPDKILNKPSGLDDKEYEIIKRHTLIGGDILNEITIVNNIADGARYHHEKYDGTGYPFGLKGDNIPLVARIIGVADTYDAMHSDRVYRKGLSDEYILEEFKRCSGKQLDPEITKVAIELIEEKLQQKYKKELEKRYVKNEIQV